MKKNIKQFGENLFTGCLIASIPFIIKELKEFMKDGGKYDL